MKLISGFFKAARKSSALVMLLLATYGQVNARVFWNKFEVAANAKNEITLSWNVTEYNNRSFRVQHSIDGVKWEDIGMVQSKNSGETMVDYSFVYTNTVNGKHFYRIQDVDLDYGSTGPSPVKTIVLSNIKESIGIWPNPASSEITLAVRNDESVVYTKALVFDLTGRMVIEKQFGEGKTTINIKDLLPGTYVLRLQGEHGAVRTEKFLKQ